LKPGDQTPAHFYVDLLGLDVLETAGEAKIALTEVIDQSELVISFDEPSSALWTAMIRGCPVVLVTNRELSNESLYDGDVLRAFTEEVALKLLRNFITNPESLNDYRDSQQLRLEKFRKSRIVHFIN
jgi:hypothetical protein